MASIDERVVAMSFENTKFEANVKTTMGTLSKLDTAIANIGKTSGLQNIEAQASRVTLNGPMSALDKLKAKLGMTTAGTAFTDMEAASNKITMTGPMSALDKLQAKLGHVTSGTTFTDMEKDADRISFEGLSRSIDGIASKFGLISTAATVAFGTVVSQATSAAIRLAKGLGLGPITGGLQEYATNLNSIQTILANTQFQGTNLDDVNKALQQLNTYSDQTIYNFGQMARNIGTFTAAGVDLDTSVSAIKGVANLAALSGSSAEQASTAMYQLSQAIASGKVSLQDWNSVVNAGMGGATFQRALAQTGEAMGTISKGALKIDEATGKATINGNSFRESITAKPGEKSWLTSEVLTSTLGQFTGDLSDAELAAQGFNEEQIAAIQATAKTAKAAATEVKTLPQVFDVAKETIGSGWALTFQAIFGNFKEAKKTFTDLSNTINGFINTNANARNKVLNDWKALGGRKELIEGIKSAFQDVVAVLKPIKDAFRDIFPAKTGQDLLDLTKNFRQLMDNIRPSQKTIDLLQRTFAGLFAVLEIGWNIIKRVGGVIGDLLGALTGGSGGFLEFTASIGDFLVSIDEAVTKGDAFKGIFDSISAVLQVPLILIREIGSAIVDLFKGSDAKQADGVSSAMDRLNTSLKPLGNVMDDVKQGWEKFLEILKNIKDALQPGFDNVVNFLSGFGTMVADAFNNINWDEALNALETGLLGGILYQLRNLFKGGISFDLGGGFLKELNNTFKALTGNLEAMQKNIQANTLLQLAAAIAVLAAGVYILSTIDSKKLASSMSAIAVGLGELVGGMKLLMAGGGKTAFLQMPFIAGAMILLATATVILAGAMKIMATMSWEEIGKGLVGVGGALAVVGAATKLINGPQLLIAGAAMIPLAIGISILATAVKIFATMSWEDMAKGLLGLGGALVAVGGGLELMGPSILLVGPGMIAMAIGLTILSGAVRSFGEMDPKKMVVGLLGISAAIISIGLAIGFFPPSMLFQAVALGHIAAALVGLGAAIKQIGDLDITTMIKGIAGIAAVLLVLAGGLYLMSGTLGGSVALLAAAAAFAIFAPTLKTLGNLKFTTMLKGLAAMAAILAVLAIAGATASAPIIALGLSLAVLGAGMLLISAALSLFVLALAQLGEKGPKSIAALVAAFGAFLLILPKMMIDFAKGMLQVAQEVVKLAPTIAKALSSVFTTLVDTITKIAPKVAEAIHAIVLMIVDIITQNAPIFINLGFTLIENLLTGLKNHMPALIEQVKGVVLAFLDGLRGNAGKFTESGANTLLAFLKGLVGQIPKLASTVVDMITKFVDGIANNVSKITAAAVNLMVKFIASIYGYIPKLVAAGAQIIIKFLSGIGDSATKLVSKGVEVAGKLMRGISKGLVDLVNIGFDAIIDFLHGIEKAIRERGKELREAGYGVADALLDGMRDGIHELGHKIADDLGELVRLLPEKVKKILGIASPSKVFMEIGQNVVLGLQKGVEDNQKPIQKSAENTAQGLIDKIKDVLGVHSPSTVMEEIGKEVGRGFAKGLEGSSDDIRGAFQSLNDKLTDAMKTARQTILEEQGKLDEERKAKKPDEEAIKASQKTILENQKILQATTLAHQALTGSLKNEEAGLIRLTKSYDDITKKLEDAQKVLDDATKARDDANKSLTSKFDTTPTISGDSKTKVQDYVTALTDQISATKSYTDTLAKLRALGLDDQTYQKLLDEGLAGKDFAEQLLAGGKTAVDGINKLDEGLLAAASTLAKNASTALYQAGVDAAQGLVDGLKSKQKELADSMDNLADIIVKAIKRKLKIKSPSEVFVALGQQTIKGFAVGIDNGAPEVNQSMEDAVTGAVDTAKTLFMKTPNMLEGLADMAPVITPVLDLTSVAKDAKQLDSLTNVVPISAALSFGQAATISAGMPTAETLTPDQAVAQKFEFNQYNTSPESLSEIEIYRQTNNQLTQLKSVVGLKP